MKKRERIAPDSAWGKYYARKGLRLVKTDRAPTPIDRMIDWRIKYMTARQGVA